MLFSDCLLLSIVPAWIQVAVYAAETLATGEMVRFERSVERRFLLAHSIMSAAFAHSLLELRK